MIAAIIFSTAAASCTLSCIKELPPGCSVVRKNPVDPKSRALYPGDIVTCTPKTLRGPKFTVVLPDGTPLTDNYVELDDTTTKPLPMSASDVAPSDDALPPPPRSAAPAADRRPGSRPSKPRSTGKAGPQTDGPSDHQDTKTKGTS